MIEIIPGGTPRIIGVGITGVLLLQDTVKKDGIVVIRISSKPWDLECQVPTGVVVEPTILSSEDDLNIPCHSATHVMAQAVQKMFPDINLDIGPFITDGSYYDFGAIDTVTPEMLCETEKRIKRIVREGQRFMRRDIAEAEGREESIDQPYKPELITTKGTGIGGAPVGVGAGRLTTYGNVRRDGTVA